MSWEDVAVEYAKWDTLELSELAMYDPADDPKVIYCRIHYITLKKAIDKWNNEKWLVNITPITHYKNSKLDDEITDRNEVLSMGVRLFNTVKKAAAAKWNYVKIIRLGVKFNTQYYISEYKLTKQEKVIKPIKKKK